MSKAIYSTRQRQDMTGRCREAVSVDMGGGRLIRHAGVED